MQKIHNFIVVAGILLAICQKQYATAKSNWLLEISGHPGKKVQLLESKIRQLCLISRDIFLQQPNLWDLQSFI
ncbi:hypothetical protein AAHE18_20G020500 [Arachis hypogaea]